MKLLLDINVVLDVILIRKPWYREAAQLLSAVESGEAEGFLASHTITTIYYIVSINKGGGAATTAVSDLLGFLTIVPAGAKEFQQALGLDFSDYEDAVQAVSALRVDADLIVTRNEGDFTDSPTPAEPPGAVLARIRHG